MPGESFASSCADLLEDRTKIALWARDKLMSTAPNMRGSVGLGNFSTFQSSIENQQYHQINNSGSSTQLFFSQISLEQALELRQKHYRSDLDLSSDVKILKWNFWSLSGGAYKDRDALLDYAALSFVMPKFSDQRTVKMFLVLNTSAGNREVYFQEFETSPHLDWVSLNISDFRSATKPRKKGRQKSLQDLIRGDAELESYGFLLSTSGLPDDPKTFLPHVISYEFNLPNHINPVDLLTLQPYKESPLKIRNSLGQLVTLKRSEVRAAVSKFFESMKNQNNQLRARRVVQEGLKSVQDELGKFGWTSTRTLNGKVSIGDFLLGFFAKREIPIEGGEFSHIHSVFAHHAQFLAGFYSLNPLEVEIVSEWISHFIAERQGEAHRGYAASSNWALWAPLFDSRSIDSVHSNRYWRDFLALPDSSK